jgi:hypothetical protein
MTQAEYKDNIYDLSQLTPANSKASELLALIESSETLLFQGQQTIQPIKLYQVVRIYQLAQTAISIITLLWPDLKDILKILKIIKR